jgi:hypothetical protein
MNEMIFKYIFLKIACLIPNTNKGSKDRTARTFKSTPKTKAKNNIIKIGLRINGLDKVPPVN